jgi:hypothetical protein
MQNTDCTNSIYKSFKYGSLVSEAQSFTSPSEDTNKNNENSQKTRRCLLE